MHGHHPVALLGLLQGRLGFPQLGHGGFQGLRGFRKSLLLPMQFHEHPDLALEHVRLHGLDQIIHGAQLVPLEHVPGGRGNGGDENDGQPGRGFVLADAPGQLEAVHAGHHDVQENQG